MKLKVEEELLNLPGFWIATGLISRMKLCSDAKLTTSRLSYTDGSETKHIYLSSIRRCQITMRILHRFIRLTCIDNVYYVACDSDLDHFYQTLLNAMKQDYSHNIIGCPKSIGGISRVVQMKEDRVERTEQMRISAMADLRSLKQMAQRVLEVARGLQTEQGPISRSLGSLKLDVFTEKTADVEQILKCLMKDNDVILLQDLFCAVNRVRLCDFLTPTELYLEVQALQAKGVCKIGDLHGVITIFSSNTSGSLNSIAKMLDNGPITALQLAQTQKMSIYLAEYLLLYAQLEGIVTRDDGLYQVQYYHNPFRD